MRKPNFFIVGAPKCGTTAMYVYLKQHPDIFMSPEKEPAYFCPDLVTQRRSEADYLELFSAAVDEKRLGEATSLYLYSKFAAREIKAFSPSARIIIMLRNPLEMIHALHAQFYYHCIEDIEDFGQALNAEEQRKRGQRLTPGGFPIERLFYREIAKYTGQIRRYMELFPPDQIKIIIFDDFKADTARLYRETCDFLEVDSTFSPAFDVINANRKVRSRFLQELLEIPGPTLRKIGKPLTPRRVRHRVMNDLRRLNSFVQPRERMNQQIRKTLQQEFAPEVRGLSELLGRDLTHWCAS